MLSRQSQLYLRVFAAMVANLDLILDFFQFRVRRQDRMNLIILSGHGVLRSLWEAELYNHGVPKDGNESIFFLYDRNFQPSREPLSWITKEEDFKANGAAKGGMNSFFQGSKILDSLKRMDSFDMATAFGSIFSNVNVPINSMGNGVSFISRNSFEIKRLRAVEAQVYEYFKSFRKDDKGLSEGNLHY